MTVLVKSENHAPQQTATYSITSSAVASSDGGTAATVQLSVPVIAALGGVILLSEDITPRLLIASVATLGGVAIVLAQRAVKTP